MIRIGGRRWTLVILQLAMLGALQACGTVKPPPSADCVKACANIVKLNCGTSQDLCDRLCTSIYPSNPAFAACVAAAGTCSAANACQ